MKEEIKKDEYGDEYKRTKSGIFGKDTKGNWVYLKRDTMRFARAAALFGLQNLIKF